MSNLTITDKNLISFLTKEDNTINNKDIDQELFDIIRINNVDILNNKKKHITELYNLFMKLQEGCSIINEYLSLKLIKNIINIFINDKDYLNYPNDMFNYTFVHFAINNNLFFKFFNINPSSDTNIFRLLISKTKALTYFNFKLNTKHVDMYITEIKKITQFIKTQLLSYLMLNSYEINLSINCIKLTHNYLIDCLEVSGDLPVKTRKLRDSVYSLFELLYKGLSNMYYLNKESSYLYNEAYNSVVQNSHNTYLREVALQLKLCKTNIEKLSTNYIFSSILYDKVFNITTIKYLEFQSESNNVLEAFPYYINKDTYLGVDFDKFIRHFDSIVYELLNHEKTALHNKCKLVLYYESFDSKYISCLLDILIAINNNENSVHIKRNKKVNMKIYSIFDTLLTEDNVKIINTTNFITIYSSLIIGVFNNINNFISIFISAQTHYNKIIIIKEIISLNILIRFLLNFYNNIRDDPRQAPRSITKESSIFYFKMAEIFYSFFNYSSKGILHTQTSMSYLNPKTVPVIPKYFTSKLDETLHYIYMFFNMIINNDTFIDIFTLHKEFYNKDHIRFIQINYGGFIYNSQEFNEFLVVVKNSETDFIEYNIKDLLELFINKYDERIKNKAADKTEYKIDIPEKFLDPIMYTPINTPVEIPDVKEIVDKYMIYNHLVFNHSNPFTNKELTTEELEEYNKNPEVIERLNIFNLEFEEWKLNNKIK